MENNLQIELETNKVKNIPLNDGDKKVYEKKRNLLKINNNILAFVILCLCVLMQNIIIGGANNAILTTIEKAYYMTSIESAIFLTLYDCANIVASPIIGYFGDKLHKPTIIGLSMIGLSIGSIITTIPEYLLIDDTISITNIDWSNNSNNSKYYAEKQLCYNDSNKFNQSSQTVISESTNCGNSNTFLNNLKYVFYLANMVNGVSSVSLYTTSISYIENVFGSTKAPLFQGIYYAVGAVGVGIGMLVTGSLLKIDASVAKLNIAKKNPNSDKFIGAWWIIFVINAFISFVLGLLVLLFANKLITIQSKISANSNVSSVDSLEAEKRSLKYHFKQFISSGCAIITNKCYVFIVICTIFETLLIKGYSSYLTKYLEFQYRLQSYTATIIAGGIGFVSLVGGSLLGGFLIKKFKWEIVHCAKFITFTLFFTSGLFLGLIIYCPQGQLIDKEYLIQNTQFLVTNNVNCNCDPSSYNFLCYKSDYVFASSCYAGCTTELVNGTEYSNCLLLNNLANLTISDNVKLEQCSRPANECILRLVIVCVFGLLVLFLSSVILMPILKIILGCVEVESQSFALGIRSLVTKLFGK
jgi:organic anion transporter 4A